MKPQIKLHTNNTEWTTDSNGMIYLKCSDDYFDPLDIQVLKDNEYDVLLITCDSGKLIVKMREATS